MLLCLVFFALISWLTFVENWCGRHLVVVFGVDYQAGCEGCACLEMDSTQNWQFPHLSVILGHELPAKNSKENYTAEQSYAVHDSFSPENHSLHFFDHLNFVTSESLSEF